MSGERLFYACGPACAKARSPNDVVGMMRSPTGLDKRFGVQDGAMNWIHSYFMGRTQTICTDNDRPSHRSLLFSVPQRSVTRRMFKMS